MHCTSNRVNDAIASIKSLEGLHNEFMKLLCEQSHVDPTLGKFSEKDDEISATCLGVKLRVPHRIVVDHDRLPATIEYSFVANHAGKDLVISNMYLTLDRGLYTDPSAQKPLCNYNNTDLINYVLCWLAEKLLDSPIFLPKKKRTNSSSKEPSSYKDLCVYSF